MVILLMFLRVSLCVVILVWCFFREYVCIYIFGHLCVCLCLVCVFGCEGICGFGCECFPVCVPFVCVLNVCVLVCVSAVQLFPVVCV